LIDKHLAPVIIFACNRPEHTSELIKSLDKNHETEKTKFYFFIDLPRDSNLFPQHTKVIELVSSWQHVDKEIYTREENFGLKKNIISGITQVSKKYPKFIVLEDDLVVSENFLNYMNYCLNRFENNEMVFHINAYNYRNFIGSNKNIYRSSLLFPWGWASWSKVWEKFMNHDYPTKNLIKTLPKNEIKKFNFYNLSYLANYSNQLILNENKKINTWFVFWYQFIFLNKKISITPQQSFVKNKGFDGSGENSGENKIMETNINSAKIKNYKYRSNQFNLNFINSVFFHLKYNLYDKFNYHVLRRFND